MVTRIPLANRMSLQELLNTAIASEATSGMQSSETPVR